MDNIADICKLPGFVFDKGFILGEVVNTGETISSKNYRVRLTCSEFETEGLLNGAFLPSGFQPENGMAVPQLVTIGHDSDGLHVAKDNYFSKLISHFYWKEGQQVREGTYPQWEQDWASIFSKKNYSQSTARHTGKGNYHKNRWFEFMGKHCRIPIREHNYLPLMKGPALFFPDSLYTPDRTVPRCLYKTEDENLKLPVSFNGRISTKKHPEKQVHIFIHGFPSPAKWHYGVLKHMLGIPPFGDDDQRKYWEHFEGMPVQEIQESVFQKCTVNPNNTSCDENACIRENVFSSVHPTLKPYCRRYLEQALRFFPISDIINVSIWTSQRHTASGPVLVEVKCLRTINSDNPFQALMRRDEIDRQESLILRGYSYDWHTSNNPTLHLFILTTFAYALGNIRRKVDVKNGYILLNSGTLLNIETEL
jgi:hypothetical protein